VSSFDFAQALGGRREKEDFELRGETMERVWIDSFDINFQSVLRNLKSLILFRAMLFALCFFADAQQAKKGPGISYLRGHY